MSVSTILSIRCFQRLDTSEATSTADLRSLTGKTPFYTTCDKMEFAEIRHLQEVSLDLPVSLLRVPHTKRLECGVECKKSMKLIVVSVYVCVCVHACMHASMSACVHA